MAQSWSGDIVGAKWYLPKGTSEDVLGYWYPDDKVGLIGNDCIVIPTTAQSPRLAHEFLNFFLDETLRVRELRQLERVPAALHLDRPRHVDLRQGRSRRPSTGPS